MSEYLISILLFPKKCAILFSISSTRMKKAMERIRNRYSEIEISTKSGSYCIMTDKGFIVSQKSCNTLHTHSYHEMIFVSKDSIDVVLEGRILTLSENEVLIVPPGVLHFFSMKNELGKGNVIAFQITEDVTDMALNENFFNMKPISIGNYPNLKNAFFRLDEYYRSSYSTGQELISAVFYEIICLFKEKIIQEKKELGGNSVIISSEYRNYIIDNYINTNFATEITPGEVAAAVYLSERQLNRLMHKNYGQSFWQRITFLRIKNAEKLLSETNMSGKEIADAIGYNSFSSFFLAFKKATGISPMAFRNKQKEISE